MTEKIYDQNPRILVFTATVLSCEKTANERYAICLDKTALFPEEGGQGADKGTLNDIPVLHTTIQKDNTITHFLASPLPVGSMVQGTVDWAQRFDYMQQHTGEHILSGLVHKRFGYNNVGFHLGETETTLDFDGPITLEEIRELERRANEVIYQNLPVKVSFPTKDELKSLDYRSKIELEGNVRIVEIPGIDLCACCAPHVASTGEIGILKVADIQSHRGGVRITILCGSRAFADYTCKQEMTSVLSALLSAKPALIVDGVNRLKAEILSKQERMNQLQARLLEYRIASLPSPSDVNRHAILFEEPTDTKAVRDAVNRLTAIYPGYAAIFTGNDNEGYQFILGSTNTDCNQLAALLRKELQAKCGGSPLMIQGSVTATKNQLTKLILSADC